MLVIAALTATLVSAGHLDPSDTFFPTTSPTGVPVVGGGEDAGPVETFTTDDDICVDTVVSGGSYPVEMSWSLAAANGQACAESGFPSGTSYRSCCIAGGSVVTVTLKDSYGDGWNGGSLNIAGVSMTMSGGYNSVRTLVWPSYDGEEASGGASGLEGPAGEAGSDDGMGSYSPTLIPTLLPTMSPGGSIGNGTDSSGGESFQTDNDVCVLTETISGSYISEVSWSLEAENGQFCNEGSFSEGTNYRSCCIEAGSQVGVTLRDSYGDGWNGAVLYIAGVTMTLSSGSNSVRSLGWPEYADGPAVGESDGFDFSSNSPTQVPTVNPTLTPTMVPTDCPTPSPVALPEPEQYCGDGTSWDGEAGQCTCAMDKTCGIPAKAKKGQTVDSSDVLTACDCETFCRGHDEAVAWVFVARRRGGKCKCLSGEKVQASVSTKDNMFMGFL